MPTVTFFGAERRSFRRRAGRKQKPLFIFEGHLTRGFTRNFWASLDLLWREGGEVDVDGVDAGNSQSALSLGATGTLRARPRKLSLRLSGGGVVARNAHGPERMDAAHHHRRVFLKGESEWRPLLEKPQVSNALPAEQGEGPAVGHGHPEGRLLSRPDRAGPLRPGLPAHAAQLRLHHHREDHAGHGREFLRICPQHREGASPARRTCSTS